MLYFLHFNWKIESSIHYVEDNRIKMFNHTWIFEGNLELKIVLYNIF